MGKHPLCNAGRRARLMVLGAGPYQIPAMRSAADLGIEVVALDHSNTAPGAAIADRFFALDTTNREAVAQLALAESVDGVISPCTDVAVPTQAHVSAVIGAPGPTVEAAETLSDKGRFRAYQARRGLPHPRTLEARQSAFDASSLEAGTYILKPARSSGSKGIFVVTPEDIAGRLPETLSFSPDGRFLVEDFVPGVQGTVEGLWIDRRITLAVLTDRLTASAPLVATLGHLWPSRLDPDANQQVLDAIAYILADLDVPSSPFDCDFVFSPNGPVILELTPRLGGNSLSKLVRAATGVDLPAEAVRLALPKSASLPDITPAKPLGPAVGILVLGSPTSGQLTFDAAEAAALSAEPWLSELIWDVPAGAPVRAFTNGRDRVGEALFFASDRGSLDARMAEILTRLKLG